MVDHVLSNEACFTSCLAGAMVKCVGYVSHVVYRLLIALAGSNARPSNCLFGGQRRRQRQREKKGRTRSHSFGAPSIHPSIHPCIHVSIHSSVHRVEIPCLALRRDWQKNAREISGVRPQALRRRSRQELVELSRYKRDTHACTPTQRKALNTQGVNV